MYSHDKLCPVEEHSYSHWDPGYHCDNACDDIECRCEFIAEVEKRTLETVEKAILAGVPDETTATLALAPVENMRTKLKEADWRAPTLSLNAGK